MASWATPRWVEKVRAFQLVRYIGDGEYLPRFYGVAYPDPAAWQRICYPIPLNLVMRAGRWLYFRMAAPRWGNRILRLAQRERGLRIESDGTGHKTRVWLDGREITDKLYGMDLRITAGEANRVTLHMVQPGMRIESDEIEMSYGYGD
jgi:hypothetical protein